MIAASDDSDADDDDDDGMAGLTGEGMSVFVAVTVVLTDLPLGLRLGGSDEEPHDVWVR
jgi:hypothetical protein